MKKIILLLLLMPIMAFSQETEVKVDSVYSTAKAKILKRQDIIFGIKQITEDALSSKYSLNYKTGEPVNVEVYYFGTPKTSLRIVGVEKTNMYTEVGINMYYRGVKYSFIGESDIEIRAVMIELVDESIPFTKTVVSSAIKKAIEGCVLQLPL